MPLDLDTSKLSQATGRKATPHDNCIVLDLGTGAFPRDIEVRLPDDDGARQIAIWDGSLNLAINDEVFCTEYGGNPKWRISGMGGADSGAGKARVDKVWDNTFGSVALSADAIGQIGISTAMPGALLDARGDVHLGNLTFAGDGDGDVSLFGDGTNAQSGAFHSKLKIFGGSSQTRSIELYQVNSGDAFVDVTFGHLEIRTLTGSGDIKFTSINDINFNDGQMFLQGSNGFLGLGSIVPTSPIYLEFEAQSAAIELRTFGTLGSSFIGQAAGGTKALPTAVASGRLLMRFSAGGYDGANFSFAQAAMDMVASEAYTASAQGTYIRFRTTAIGSTSLATRVTITDVGFLGVNGVTNPSTELDIGAGAMEFEEMTAPAAGAANTARLFTQDNGAGKTQLAVRFNSGAIQILATEP